MTSTPGTISVYLEPTKRKLTLDLSGEATIGDVVQGMVTHLCTTEHFDVDHFLREKIGDGYSAEWQLFREGQNMQLLPPDARFSELQPPLEHDEMFTLKVNAKVAAWAAQVPIKDDGKTHLQLNGREGTLCLKPVMLGTIVIPGLDWVPPAIELAAPLCDACLAALKAAKESDQKEGTRRLPGGFPGAFSVEVGRDMQGRSWLRPLGGHSWGLPLLLGGQGDQLHLALPESVVLRVDQISCEPLEAFAADSFAAGDAAMLLSHPETVLEVEVFGGAVTTPRRRVRLHTSPPGKHSPAEELIVPPGGRLHLRLIPPKDASNRLPAITFGAKVTLHGQVGAFAATEAVAPPAHPGIVPLDLDEAVARVGGLLRALGVPFSTAIPFHPEPGDPVSGVGILLDDANEQKALQVNNYLAGLGLPPVILVRQRPVEAPPAFSSPEAEQHPNADAAANLYRHLRQQTPQGAEGWLSTILFYSRGDELEVVVDRIRWQDDKLPVAIPPEWEGRPVVCRWPLRVHSFGPQAEQ